MLPPYEQGLGHSGGGHRDEGAWLVSMGLRLQGGRGDGVPWPRGPPALLGSRQPGCFSIPLGPGSVFPLAQAVSGQWGGTGGSRNPRCPQPLFPSGAGSWPLSPSSAGAPGSLSRCCVGRGGGCWLPAVGLLPGPLLVPRQPGGSLGTRGASGRSQSRGAASLGARLGSGAACACSSSRRNRNRSRLGIIPVPPPRVGLVWGSLWDGFLGVALRRPAGPGSAAGAVPGTLRAGEQGLDLPAPAASSARGSGAARRKPALPSCRAALGTADSAGAAGEPRG